MSLHTGLGLNGYYDENGNWQRTKFCFVSCGQRCDCLPPGGLHYSAAHDKRLKATKEATPPTHEEESKGG